jgi:uncharacterized repeat protein (TIGR02543 family)
MKRIVNVFVLLTLLALTFSSLGSVPAYAADQNFFVSRVGRYNPAGGYANLSGAQFVVKFSEDVNPDTVTAESFAARPSGGVMWGTVTEVSVLTANFEYLVTVSDYSVTDSSIDDKLGLDVLPGIIQNTDGDPLQNGDSYGEFYYIDATPPTIYDFTVPATSSSLAIPITTFSAGDDWSGVAGYLITESATPPLATDAGWVATQPATYTVGADGSYTLYPWVKDAAGSVSMEYATPANVTVTVATSHTVTFNANGGSGTMSPQITNTPTALSPNTFTRTGYTFAGWSTTATGAVVYANSAVYNFSADITLYARWTPINHTVTFNANGGSGAMPAQIKNTPTALSTNTFTRAGYTFAGWSTTATGAVVYANSAVYDFSADITLYARWTGISQTVTFTSIAAQDGWVLESSENSNNGGSVNSAGTTFNLGDDATRKQYRGILSFNTGALLPDNAVITAVTLKVMKQNIIGGGNPVTTFQGFMVDIRNGFFGTNALQAGDFQAAASATYGPFNTALVSGWYNINVTSGKAHINKLATNSGLTQMRLRFKLDDNNNAIANILSLYSGNAPAASRPQLVITYTLP